jgi:hypothetical protein
MPDLSGILFCGFLAPALTRFAQPAVFHVAKVHLYGTAAAESAHRDFITSHFMPISSTVWLVFMI